MTLIFLNSLEVSPNAPPPGHGYRVKVYKSIHCVTWFRDDPLPDVKTRVVMDGRTDRRTDKNRAQVITVTLHLRFAARVNDSQR